MIRKQQGGMFMKKIVICVFILLMLCFCFVGCEVDFEKLFKNDSNSKDSDSVDVNTIETLGYNNTNLVSSNNAPTIVESYRDDINCYYLFYLGKINNVVLDNDSNPSLIQIQHKDGMDIEREFSTETVSASTIRNQTESIVERSFNVTFAVKGIIPKVFEGSFRHDFTKTSSFSETYEKASSFSSSKNDSVKIRFSGEYDSGYYGYRLTGAVEAYAAVSRKIQFDSSTDTYNIEYYSSVIKTWYGFYYYANSSEFLNEKVNELNIRIPDNLDIPQNYKNSQTDFDSPITINKTVRTGVEKIYNKNYGKTSDNVSFNIPTDYTTLRDRNSKIDISIYVDIKEFRTNENVENNIDIYGQSGNKLGELHLKHHQGDWQTYRIVVDNVSIDDLYCGNNNYMFTIKYNSADKNYNDWYLGTVKVEISVKF